MPTTKRSAQLAAYIRIRDAKEARKRELEAAAGWHQGSARTTADPKHRVKRRKSAKGRMS